MTIGDVMAMPSSEFTGWMEHRNRIPLVGERIEILLANLLSLTANVNRNETVDPFSPSDFLPWYSERQERTTRTAIETTMQSAQETDRINRVAEIFFAKLAKVQ